MSAEGSRQTANESVGNLLPSAAAAAAADNNANVDQNKGAIPKARRVVTAARRCSPKRQQKLNNNVIEELPSLTNGAVAVKTNGYARNSSSIEFDGSPAMRGKLENHSSSVVDGLLANNLHANLTLHNGEDVENPPLIGTCKINMLPKTIYNNSDTSSDDDDDDDENELLSVSDDGCIYTYKGDQREADLPSSFFSLDVPFVENGTEQQQRRQGDEIDRNSSPEMDFLEMDFDPGPSGDADSDSNSNTDLNNVENLPEDVKAKGSESAPCKSNREETTLRAVEMDSVKKNDYSLPRDFATPSTSSLRFNSNSHHEDVGLTLESSKSEHETGLTNDNSMPWSCVLSQRTTSSSASRSNKRYHCTKGELVSPGEKDVSPVSDFSTYTWIPRPTLENGEHKIMVWNEQEALVKQITQIGPSACGATAVLNVLAALRFPIPSLDKIQEAVVTRLRSNNSPLPKYLLSRSVAGSTHEDLIAGLQKLSGGQIYARFFPMYPERVVNLYMWLGFWIQNGAVPIATVNLQKCPALNGVTPDAWHHQMIFGVAPDQIYLTNPLEVVDSGQLWPQLCSESVLLVRRDDVLSRWDFFGDLKNLMEIRDTRWRRINVVGQVASMVRQSMRKFRPGFTNTTHIRIPAEYSSGITLAINVNSPAFTLLSQCPELPLLHPSDTDTALYNNNINNNNNNSNNRSDRLSK